MSKSPRVGILMGSATDYEIMRAAGDLLTELGVEQETRVISAHRTPDLTVEYARRAEERGLRAIIAGAGGAAALPGMLAAITALPVIGVPIPSTSLAGLDSVLSILQMPKGTPVATMAIGRPGAINAALFAASIIALGDGDLRQRLKQWRQARAEEVLATKLPE
ncbi:MAG TPA: 5-(carboxyamino)imidazole ribonucleotide mutase [Candidatus Binataceae bacterium]|nr:5-(carboxyamino)imidazole ribonucleotide mutase [Candidatus Binataceae bacterium]